MGLWLKCPGCHANNPLSLRVCSHCGQSLDNLPPEKRVYVLGPLSAPPPEPAPPPAEAAAAGVNTEPASPPPPEEPPQAAPKPKRTKKKKG